MPNVTEMRYEFGRNWRRFVRRSFTQERVEIAKRHLLKFAGRESLEGADFLDIGCGSGLSSLAAHQAGARRIHSFDYDINSVATTELLYKKAGSPPNWTVEQGDVLDGRYIRDLERWNFVYSWGVLHHTGDVWHALRNAQSLVSDDGTLYVALYSADAEPAHGQAMWLATKQDYNQSGRWRRHQWEWWYIWNFYMNGSLLGLPTFLRRMAVHRFVRGMNLFADLRDWLGGWPMEYTHDQEVVDLVEREGGFKLINISTGEACSEFLFARSANPATRTIVDDFVRARKTRCTTEGHAVAKSEILTALLHLRGI